MLKLSSIYVIPFPSPLASASLHVGLDVLYSACALCHRKEAWLCCWAVLHLHRGCIQPWLQILLLIRREATLKKKNRTYCILRGMKIMLVQFDPENFPYASVGEAGSLRFHCSYPVGSACPTGEERIPKTHRRGAENTPALWDLTCSLDTFKPKLCPGIVSC